MFIVKMMLMSTTQPVLMMIPKNTRNTYPVLQDLAQAMVDSIKKDRQQYDIIGIGTNQNSPNSCLDLYLLYVNAQDPQKDTLGRRSTTLPLLAHKI